MSENGASTGSIFEMDATISHNYSLAGRPTEYAVEAGSKSSDHYSKDLVSLSCSGIVSDVKYSSGVEFSRDVADFEAGLVALRDSGMFFACNFSEDQLLIKNCLFTSLQVNRSPENGKYAIAVSFTVKQVQVANVAQVIAAAVPFETFKDPAEEKKKSSGGTKSPEERETDLLDISLEFLSGGLLSRDFRF